MSIDNMFCNMLDEELIGKMDADGDNIKILTKCVKMGALTQVNFGVMSTDAQQHTQIIDYFYKSCVTVNGDAYWANTGIYLISVDVLEFANSKCAELPL